MCIYIAARYHNKERNHAVATLLRKEGFDVFLPREIRLRADSREKSASVFKKCIEALDFCSVLLVVGPYGRDVAFEIGYFQKSRVASDNIKYVVQLNYGDFSSEADDMISQVIDFESSDIKEIVNYLMRVEPRKKKLIRQGFKQAPYFESDAFQRIKAG